MTVLNEPFPAGPSASEAERVEASVAAIRALIEQLGPDGREILVRLLREAEGSKPPQRGPKYRKFGAYKGRFSIGPEFFEPLPDDELRAWGEI